ncbi:MAG: S8 family serine peptidase [Candidatus Alcyoniella australis]|nr:S8 family serine peptidase [Candidatus Alcyoniella australis]
MRARLFVMIAAALVAFPSAAPALSIIDQDPHMGTFKMVVDEPLIVQFDAPVNPATLDDSTFYVTVVGGGAHVAGTLSLDAADSVVFTPSAPWPWAQRQELHVTSGLLSSGGLAFDGVYPFGAQFIANIPNDLEPDNCAEIEIDFENLNFDELFDQFSGCFIESNMLTSWKNIDPESTVLEDYYTYTGCSATEAWKWTTGSPEVIIAVIDDGLNSYADPELRDNLFLNRGELELPRIGDTPCADYDCNGDGRFNWRDYADDNRLAGYANPYPDAILEYFQDGVDDDGNGLIDDISGYDFFRMVPEALGVPQFPEGKHGGDRAKDCAGVGNNNEGNRPGVCPNCTVLPIRVSSAVLGDFNIMSAAASYANSMGAQIIEMAMGSLDWSMEAEQVFIDIYRNGTLTIAASGDENGYHHIWPAMAEQAMSIKAILPIPNLNVDGWIFDIATFLESYCTNYGARITLTAPTGACSSHATAITAGCAGLLLSRAYDLGIDLSPNEIKQLLTMTADDIFERCITIMPGGCKPGWDEHFAYGRVNVRSALLALGEDELGLPRRIPPETEINSPRWFSTFDPNETPTLDIGGRVYARGEPYQYVVEYAAGVEPDDERFIEIESGTGSSETNGVLATLDLVEIFDAEYLAAPPSDPDDFTVTLRVRSTTYDALGNPVYGDDRRAIALKDDRRPDTGLVDGFPISIEGSGASSVVLYDLLGSGAGRLDVVMGAGDGRIYVFRYNDEIGTWEIAPGWPVDLTLPGSLWRDGVIGTVAVADLFGNGTPFIVAATFGGNVFAVWPEGNEHLDAQGDSQPYLDGFPVKTLDRDPYPAIDFAHGRQIITSPAVGDLDLDGVLEIVVTSYDQRCYVWKPLDRDRDGEADLLPGWPVMVKSLDGVVEPELVCEGDPYISPVLASPAIAILDPDSEDEDLSDYPVVIQPSSETCEGGSTGLKTSRVYAIYHDGNDHPGGPFAPGWPALVTVLGESIPIPPLTIGSTSSPCVAHEGGRTFIGTGSFFMLPELIEYNDGELKITPQVSFVGMGATANPTFAHFTPNGRLNLIIPMVGFAVPKYFLNTSALMSFGLSAWEVTNPLSPVFQALLDDADFFINPVVGDIDGDGMQETLAGSGGYLLHAYNSDGAEPDDWPKFTQNFIISSPALGDLDGDGLLEVVLNTHNGNLFAWNTVAPACSSSGSAPEWPMFGHDEHNTSFLGHDATPPGSIHNLQAWQSHGPAGPTTLAFTSPGNDWWCGFVTDYDVRYSTDPEADLSDPLQFTAAPRVPYASIPETKAGGELVMFDVDLPDAQWFAVQTADSAGNLSRISNVSGIGPAPGSSPLTPDDAEDNDDDEDEACCGSD